MKSIETVSLVSPKGNPINVNASDLDAYRAKGYKTQEEINSEAAKLVAAAAASNPPANPSGKADAPPNNTGDAPPAA